jgi:hypothetical protein
MTCPLKQFPLPACVTSAPHQVLLSNRQQKKINMQDFIGQKVLITTYGWFYGSDGKQYRAAWGTLKAIHEAGKTLGFIPNRSHANWFVEIGNLVIMGCQVMYVMRSEEKPYTGPVEDYQTDSVHGITEYKRPGAIWVAD